MERHKIGPDGARIDEVGGDPLSISDIAIYEAAAYKLSQMRVPLLLRHGNSRERVFFAFFDGTGNDLVSDREHATNVGKLTSQMLDPSRDRRVAVGYVAGPGTQANLIGRLADGAVGYTYDDRLKKMYGYLVDAVEEWRRTDPGVDISVISTGFSRGAEQAAGFTRMVHELGVQIGERDGTHQLISPGTIPQVVGLFDPVGTGHPHAHDRRLPPSVVSGFQIYARDERRNLFPATQIIRPGQSVDGRFLGVVVPGAHSDIGGGYHADGLSVINGNLMTDFINAHSEVPLLERQPEPLDPSRYVISHSDEHAFFYRTSHFTQNGERDVLGAEVSPSNCRPVIYCEPPAPLDPALAERIASAPVSAQEPAVPMQLADIHLASPRTAPIGQRQGRSAVQVFPATDGEAFTFTPGPMAADASRVTAVPDRSNPALPRNDPRHEQHPDHRMYQSIYLQMGELHARHGIDLSKAHLERVSAAALVEAKRGHMTSVTDIEFGKGPKGEFRPILHVMQAFDGNVDDPRTRWASFDASQAVMQSVEQTIAPLEAANDHLQQRQLGREQELAPQPDVGLSMRM
ncbi:DUF2235 domain-containing protein [Luteibacter sahnii]|uniref:DUF2235 domain-containing protein n=1 Tax=Luteibacter sahnii TaxID=3021977 RepID=UPI002A6A83F0|nr:DUF2235 domain-containing protein [Luteibacter sp. PPL193]MDY1548970.1 DUF2235 domain-containing protein [Luteibacter sp. PPL193]